MFKVVGGVNSIGAPNMPNTDLSGARGCSRVGSFTSPSSGYSPPDRQYHPPPSFAERIHDMNVPDYAKITTHKTERTES